MLNFSSHGPPPERRPGIPTDLVRVSRARDARTANTGLSPQGAVPRRVRIARGAKPPSTRRHPPPRSDFTLERCGSGVMVRGGQV